MKLVLTLLLVLVLGAAAGLLFQGDNGYVLLAWHGWSVETSVLALLLLLVVAGGAARLAWGVIAQGWRLPRRWRARQRERAQSDLDEGMAALLQGRWKAAEQQLLGHVSHARTPALNFIFAARAAHLAGETNRRDKFLGIAADAAGQDDPTVLLTRAEFLIAERDYRAALAVLQQLPSPADRSPKTLRARLLCYRMLHEWDALKDLLPALREQDVLAADDWQPLAREIHVALLERAGDTHDREAVDHAWNDVPKSLREGPALIQAHANALEAAGDPQAAAATIAEFLGKRWDEGLVLRFGEIEADAEAQLHSVEKWLRQHGEQSALLLTAARLYKRRQIWGKARSCLERSIHAGPTPEAYLELGALLAELGESEQAQTAWRAGLELAGRRHSAAPAQLPAPQPIAGL